MAVVLKKNKHHKHHKHNNNNNNNNNTEHTMQLNVNDVLLGRGTGPNDHPGNIHFRSLVRGAQQQYIHSKVRGEKTRIARRVIAAIRETAKGRFLRKLSPAETRPKSFADAVDVYVVVEEEHTLVQKTKQAFRHLIRQNNAQAKSCATSGGGGDGGGGEGDAVCAAATAGTTATAIPGRKLLSPPFASASFRSSGRPSLDTNAGPDERATSDRCILRASQTLHGHGSSVYSSLSSIAQADRRTTNSIQSKILSHYPGLPNAAAAAAPTGAAAPAACNNDSGGLSLVESLVAAQRCYNGAMRLQEDAYLLRLIAEKKALVSRMSMDAAVIGGTWSTAEAIDSRLKSSAAQSSTAQVSPKISDVIQAALAMTTPLPAPHRAQSLTMPSRSGTIGTATASSTLLKNSATQSNALLELLEAESALRGLYG